jgi:hypothetical protein
MIVRRDDPYALLELGIDGATLNDTRSVTPLPSMRARNKTQLCNRS